MKSILIADLQALAREAFMRSIKHEQRHFYVELTPTAIVIRVTDLSLIRKIESTRQLEWEKAAANLSAGFIKYMFDEMEAAIDRTIKDAQ